MRYILMMVLVAGCVSFMPKTEPISVPEAGITEFKQLYVSTNEIVVQWKTITPKQPSFHLFRGGFEKVEEIDLTGKIREQAFLWDLRQNYPEFGIGYNASEDKQWHQASIEGLTPGTRYRFMIDDCSLYFETPHFDSLASTIDEDPTVAFQRLNARPIIQGERHGVLIEWKTDCLPSWQCVQIMPSETFIIEHGEEGEPPAEEGLVPLRRVEPRSFMLPREDIHCESGTFGILIPEDLFMSADGIRIWSGSPVTGFPSCIDLGVTIRRKGIGEDHD